MPNPQLQGYLENPYLQGDYLGGTAQHSFGQEVRLIIANNLKPIGMEVNANIKDHIKPMAVELSRNIVDRPKPIGLEVIAGLFKQGQIALEVQKLIADASDSHGMELEAIMIKDHALGMEAKLILNKEAYYGFEVETKLLDTLDFQALQTELQILSDKPIGLETLRIIKNYERSLGAQLNGYITGFTKGLGFEIRMDKSFPHISCDGLGYLNQPYLSTPYLAGGYCVPGPMEISLIMKKDKPVGSEAQRIIEGLLFTASEVRMIIKDKLTAIAMEVERLRASTHGMQINFILYNNYNLRVMKEFPSRGVSGGNWTASSTKAGDFAIANVNTDIVEQRWQSADGVTFVTLICDTQKAQGISVDTIAMLGHNLTTSASVTVESSNLADFSVIGESIPITIVKNEDVYYIAPTYPMNQWRYWRFIISDVTNPESNIKIGTIIFGPSTILQGECFVDTVRKRKIHFSDKINTEGFTNVSNDRSLKKAINIDFQNMAYSRGNYKNLIDVFDFARTSLKCLWIPDSRDPARFAVFGKLSTMPEETHLNMGDEADYVDFSIEVDESL